MSNHRALVIDDEPDILELLDITLSRMGIEVDTASNITEAKRLLQKTDYNLCLTDMKLPDGNGIDFVKHIQLEAPQLPVAVITAHGNMDTAVQSMKAGAFDFLTKPIELTSLRELVKSAVYTSTITTENEFNTGIIGTSYAITTLNKSIHKLSRSQAPVYISGESGSGKELVARSIHQLSSRKNGPFIPVNCGAIPKDLMESEFFGHKKGSFTGASQDKLGLFQAAEGGTLFLDEVADLPLEMQVKLLRAIQEKSVRPIGANNEVSTNIRILCATHKNLEQLIESGDFRQDLFYRLNVIHIKVPALRERTPDLPELINFFLQKLNQNSPEQPIRLSLEAINAIKNYHFPGNIRELENILERAFTLCENAIIEVEDLQLSKPTLAYLKQANIDDKPSEKTGNHYALSQNYENVDQYLGEIEKEILCAALDSVRWNKTMAAKKLGITFRSLRYRLQKLEVNTD